jgi:hypothetical protein
MSENLGNLTGISFCVLITPWIDEYFHKGLKTYLNINDYKYPVKIKSRYRKGKELHIKCEIES